jgi:translation elongation factor P/translation initiation factor 5A
MNAEDIKQIEVEIKNIEELLSIIKGGTRSNSYVEWTREQLEQSLQRALAIVTGGAA